MVPPLSATNTLVLQAGFAIQGMGDAMKLQVAGEKLTGDRVRVDTSLVPLLDVTSRLTSDAHADRACSCAHRSYRPTCSSPASSRASSCSLRSLSSASFGAQWGFERARESPAVSSSSASTCVPKPPLECRGSSRGGAG